MICFDAAADSRIPSHYLEIHRRRFEDQISRIDAEHIIDCLKAADIEIHDIIRNTAIGLHQSRRLAVEGFPVVDSSQRIFLDIAMHKRQLLILSHLFHFAPFVLLARHDILDTTAHNRRIVRFHDIIGSPHFHGPCLAGSIAAGRHDYNRDLCILVMMFNIRQHFKAIHDRHDQINQYNAHGLALDNFQGFLPIYCLNDGVFILKKLGQHNPVDFYIINNQHHWFFIHNIAFFARNFSV